MINRREFIGSIVAAICVGRIVENPVVAIDPPLFSSSISNRPNSNIAFTEESLRKALKEFEEKVPLYPNKILYSHTRIEGYYAKR